MLFHAYEFIYIMTPKLPSVRHTTSYVLLQPTKLFLIFVTFVKQIVSCSVKANDLTCTYIKAFLCIDNIDICVLYWSNVSTNMILFMILTMYFLADFCFTTLHQLTPLQLTKLSLIFVTFVRQIVSCSVKTNDLTYTYLSTKYIIW